MEYFEQNRYRLSPVTEQELTHTRSLDYVRWLSCLASKDVGHGGPLTAAKLFEVRFPRAVGLVAVQKAAVAFGTTSDSGWAAPLAALKPLTDAFLSYVRPRTILGRLNTRRVPFNVGIAAQTGTAAYAWAGQGIPKPVSAAAFGLVSLTFAKAIGLVVLTRELVDFSAPSAEIVMRDELAAGLALFLDTQLLDSTVADSASTPGSILNGITPIASAGASIANAQTDLSALVNAFVAAHPNVDDAAFVLSPGNALVLAASGAYPDLRLDGTGFIAGTPAIVSAAAGARIVLLDPRYIAVADDDGLVINISRQATVQMDSAPDAPPTASTVHTSLWQQNLVGLLAERYIRWKRARTSAVQWVSGATYAA